MSDTVNNKPKLQNCFFCGCEDIEIETSDDGDMDNGGFGWAAFCICSHCNACGSYMGGSESEIVAIEQAIDNWQNAGRLHWYDHISRIWRNLIDDIEYSIGKLFD